MWYCINYKPVLVYLSPQTFIISLCWKQSTPFSPTCYSIQSLLTAILLYSVKSNILRCGLDYVVFVCTPCLFNSDILPSTVPSMLSQIRGFHPLYAQMKFHSASVPHSFSFSAWWGCKLFLFLGYYEYCYSNMGMQMCLWHHDFIYPGCNLVLGLLD